jgi:hypothetical protein
MFGKGSVDIVPSSNFHKKEEAHVEFENLIITFYFLSY